MLRLDDWIVESRLIKTYFSLGCAFAAFATRSVTEQGMTRRREFSAFAWKI